MMTQKAMATARRNLAQRIERFWKLHEGKGDVSVWQTDQALRAIELLRAGEYPDGETAMMHAEMPDAFEPQSYRSPERKDTAVLLDHLKAALTSE